MKYLSRIFTQNGGTCKPIIQSYKDSNGHNKVSTNMTVVSYNGKVIQNTRLTDYLYVPIQAKDVIQYIPIIEDMEKTVSCNIIGELDDPNPRLYEIIGDKTFKLTNDISYYGLEDIRLVVWNGVLYGIGFRPDIIAGKVIAQLIEYNNNFTIKRSWFLNTNKTMEKNWQPIEDMPFTFMYDPDKSYVLTLDMDELREADNDKTPTVINEIQTPEFTFALSGSTQLIHLKDNRFVSICHTCHRYIGATGLERWVYNHYFVVYDEHMNKIWTSEPFRFVSDCMEFTCGMCHHNNDLYISFTMYDGIPHIMSIPFDTFHEILSNMMSNSGVYEDVANDEYMVQSYNSNNITGAAKIPYMFYLENIHRLDNPVDIVELLNSMDIWKSIHNSMLLYFIIRRQDNKDILNEYEKRI